MANNTNAQAVAFDNNYARPGADAVVSCYLTMKRVLQVWNGQSVGTVIPNDSNPIDDGSLAGGTHAGSPDGRANVTDAQVQTLVANMTTLVGYLEASSSLMLNQFLQVSVHAQSALS